jgi:glutathione-regulated potassium-efflux system ancillary protein KefC
MLVAAVALSMLIGPLVLVLMDKLLLKRFADMKDCQADGAAQAARAHEISEPQDAEIIIAGFGRYGQIVARVLLTQGVPATILDHSVEMLEVDLLRIAGADKARVLVIAVDSSEQSLKIAARVRKRFPHLQIVARARDMAHWYQLRDLGVHHVEREVFESSLVSARTVLELTGHSPAQALHTTTRFREHNLELIERMYPHHKDQAQLIAVARQGRQQLIEQMAKERQEAQQDEDQAPAPAQAPPPGPRP